MLHKTSGIVLSHLKFRETSIIAKIFTEALGSQAYVIHGVRTQKPRYSMALFQPLTRLDLVVYHKKQVNLQRVAEVKCHAPNSHILGNLKKATIAVFLAELLTKVIREEEHNESLFHFLWQAIGNFEAQTTDYELFHLTFMLQLCHYLGFGISTAQELYAQLRRSGQHWEMRQEAIESLASLLAGGPQGHVAMDKATQRNMTEAVIKFYQLHMDALDTLQSLKVLQALG
ncbi:MAG: DNA repair protein RecO [Roseivirga sp.]